MKSLQPKPLRLLACLAAAGLAPVAAHANDGFYVGVEGGLNFLTSQNFDASPALTVDGKFGDGFLIGLTGGYSFASGLRPEVALDYHHNTLDSAQLNLNGSPFSSSDIQGNETAYTLLGNLWYDVKSSQGLFSSVHPYIGGGAGLARIGMHGVTVPNASIQLVPFGPTYQLTNAIDQDKTAPVLQFGTGLIFDLVPGLAFSFDYRYLRSDDMHFDTVGGLQLKSHYEAQSLLLNLEYFFGKPLEVAAAPEPVEAAVPPPAPEPPPAPPEPVAPVDSDGDGVPDNVDKCPNTPQGFKVDADGCIIQQTVILQSVNFKTNSDELTESAQRKLDEVSAGLVGQPTLRIEIDGHTDSRGTQTHNQKLSERRAASVRRYLVSNGVNPDTLASKGFGFDKPIASNDTEEGRAQNRRVEFIVLNPPPPDVKVLQQSTPAQ